MYEYVEGKFKGLNKDYVVIDNNGIGYRIFTSGNSICSMPALNESIKLYVEQIVRPDFIGLYGFVQKKELDMFLMLINVNGIGAKVALALLSVSTVDTLKRAICFSDESVLIKASGVGKKSAQRIILELKDKINIPYEDSILEKREDIFLHNDKVAELNQALLSLGFNENDIKNVVKVVMDKFHNESLEFIVKESLKNLMR